MRKHHFGRAVALLVSLAILSAFPARPAAATAETVDVTTLYKARDVDASWSPAKAEVIDLSALSPTTLTISAAGDYVLSGVWQGQVIIEAGKDDKVRLILNGVSITSPQGPAIYEKQADKLIVTLAEGTSNTLTDGAKVQDGDDEIGAALYAEDDLSINGAGELTAHGTAKHGIQSKADLVLAGGRVTIDAVNDGLRGRNSVLVLDGELRVTAGGDGIVSTREDAEGKGWVVISGGNVTVQTGDGAGEMQARSSGKNGGWGRGWTEPVRQTGDNAVSQKGIKAATDLTVLDGTLALDCADDGLHAANVTVSGGSLSVRSGDDGLHADASMRVDGGVIDISQCYEGVEGTDVTIAGGSLRIVASDDAVNAAGGNDQSGFGGRGNDRFSRGDSAMLAISGGTLTAIAGGDALDSNGSILITGGVTGVWAASRTGEGAIDFNGSGTVSGGTLLVASTGGVMQDTAQLTGQSILSVSVQGEQGPITLLNGDGDTLAVFDPENAYDTVLISSDRLADGDALTLLSGEAQVFAGTMSHSLSGGGNQGFGNQGFGGGGRRRR